jgi:hypothetical protein
MAESTQMFKLYGEHLVISAPPLTLPPLEEPTSRISPLIIEYPIKQTDSLIYKIPSGYKIINLPADTVMESPFGKYSFSTLVTGEMVIVKRSVTIHTGTYSSDQYDEVYEFLRRVKESDRASVIITSKQPNHESLMLLAYKKCFNQPSLYEPHIVNLK